MASITITLTEVCAGGNHLTFVCSGARNGTFTVMRDDMLAPISDADAQAFLSVICKLAKSGRTNAQARTLLQAGVTVTV